MDNFLALKDDPEDIKLLIVVLREAIALEELGKINKIEKHLSTIDSYLKTALKKDRIKYSDLSLVHYYIISLECKASTVEYALMRTL